MIEVAIDKGFGRMIFPAEQALAKMKEY